MPVPPPRALRGANSPESTRGPFENLVFPRSICREPCAVHADREKGCKWVRAASATLLLLFLLKLVLQSSPRQSWRPVSNCCSHPLATQARTLLSSCERQKQPTLSVLAMSSWFLSVGSGAVHSAGFLLYAGPCDKLLFPRSWDVVVACRSFPGRCSGVPLVTADAALTCRRPVPLHACTFATAFSSVAWRIRL